MIMDFNKLIGEKYGDEKYVIPTGPCFIFHDDGTVEFKNVKEWFHSGNDKTKRHYRALCEPPTITELPKDGEWWLCDFVGRQVVLYYDGGLRRGKGLELLSSNRYRPIRNIEIKCSDVQKSVGYEYQIGETIPALTPYWKFSNSGEVLIRKNKTDVVIVSRDCFSKKSLCFQFVGKPPVEPINPKDGEWWLCEYCYGQEFRFYTGGKWYFNSNIKDSNYTNNVKPIRKVDVDG